MSEKSDNSSEKAPMTTLVEAQGLMREIAGLDGSVKERLSRAYRRVRTMSFNRVRDIWHGDRRCRVRADEIENLRCIARQMDELEGKDELAELRARVARLEAAVARGQDLGCA